MDKVNATKALPPLDPRETPVGEHLYREIPIWVTDNCVEEIVGGSLCSCRLESARETTVEREPCQAAHLIAMPCAGALVGTGLRMIWSLSNRDDFFRAVHTFAILPR